jgi:hypothetical protein
MNETTFTDIFEANARKVADDRESFKQMYWVDKDELIKMTEALIAVREAEAVDKALSTFRKRASFYFDNKRKSECR